MITSMHRMGVAALALAGAAATMAPMSAQARTIVDTDMEIDVASATTRSQIVLAEGADPVVLLSARDITDGAFTKLDLRIVLNEGNATQVEKMVDQGFTTEPAGCAPNAYGPLDMEDGLRYFLNLAVDTPGGDTEKVRVTVYPGSRSTHALNDVFCEYSEDGGDMAVLRVTGYYYVIHRKLEDATDIQLRAITLTDAELDALP